jgi:CubicO group peptidase (beta-lactamase class C family)
MELTRRGWLGATAAGAAMAASPALGDAPVSAAGTMRVFPARFSIVAPGSGGHDYRPALEALAAYAVAELNAVGLPGMTLSVTDAEGFTAVLALGWSDVATHTPMRADSLFQIGSISKSFLALTVLSLADAGMIDVDAPITAYLPEAPWPAAPITASQLMAHTAGLADGPGMFPRTPGGRLWTGFTPGSKFSYSNTGFELLGATVERLTGMSHAAAILQRVRAPLGVADIAGTIDQANRGRFPAAYWTYDTSLAADLPGAALAPAKWDPEDTAAGSIAATSEMMARYLRGLLKVARDGGGILSPAMGRRFATGVIASDADFGPGSHYAQGVAVQPVDGLPCLHHTGGMVAFSSSFHADPAAGVAAFASVNARIGGYRPRQTTAYAIQLLRAVRAKTPLPLAPDPLQRYRIKAPERLYGRFVGPEGSVFTLGSGEDFPRYSGPDGIAPLRLADGQLVLPFGPHALDPVSEDGAVVGFWRGQTLYGRDAAHSQPAAPERLRALAGLYINRDPWVGFAEVFARGETLYAPGVGVIIERGGYWSAEKDTGGVERLRFDGMLNGLATRLNVSGVDFLRLKV